MSWPISHWPSSQSLVRVPFGSAVEVAQLNRILEDKKRLHLAAKHLYAKVVPLPPMLTGYCGDCASVQEDDPRGLCAVHSGKCVNCAASEDLHDGEPSRTKVDAAGNPVVERWCESCSPITERHPAEADPFSLASEEEANPRLTAEQYVERLRLRDGSGHARSYGDAADEQEDHVGQLPHTVTTDFGQGRR